MIACQKLYKRRTRIPNVRLSPTRERKVSHCHDVRRHDWDTPIINFPAFPSILSQLLQGTIFETMQ